MNDILQYFRPSTIEEMYIDLNEARLNLLQEGNMEDYHIIMFYMEELEQYYGTLTGEELVFAME